MGDIGLGLLAGLLSSLSPCVLPLIPIVFGAAMTEHRLGPVALATGLAVSFVAIGLFVATIGYSIGLDQDVFRAVAAVLMIAIGGVLLAPNMQARLAVAAGPFGNWVQSHGGDQQARGLGGQFMVGLLLGAVWAPCVGPTLGAASVLAAQGEDLAHVAAVMLAFGLGAAIPLLLIGSLSREALLRMRDRMMQAGKVGKYALGGLLVLIGVMILTGFDKRLEAVLVDASPAWLTTLTTRF